MKVHTYRTQDGISNYEAGDILLNLDTGEAVKAVRTGAGVQLETCEAPECVDSRCSYGQHGQVPDHRWSQGVR